MSKNQRRLFRALLALLSLRPIQLELPKPKPLLPNSSGRFRSLLFRDSGVLSLIFSDGAYLICYLFIPESLVAYYFSVFKTEHQLYFCLPLPDSAPLSAFPLLGPLTQSPPGVLTFRRLAIPTCAGVAFLLNLSSPSSYKSNLPASTFFRYTTPCFNTLQYLFLEFHEFRVDFCSPFLLTLISESILLPACKRIFRGFATLFHFYGTSLCSRSNI